MDEKDIENVDSDFAELILIMQSVWNEEEDKDWGKSNNEVWFSDSNDWLLDDDGNKVFL